MTEWLRVEGSFWAARAGRKDWKTKVSMGGRGSGVRAWKELVARITPENRAGRLRAGRDADRSVRATRVCAESCQGLLGADFAYVADCRLEIKLEIVS